MPSIHPPHAPPDGDGETGQHKILTWTIVTLVGVYMGLRFGIPLLSVLVGVSANPAPVPKFAMAIYMMCAGLGALVYVSSEDKRWHAFTAPIVRAFVVPPGEAPVRRFMPLVILPLVVGWVAWGQIMPGTQSPREGRVQHPGIPDRFAELENPFGALDEAEREEAEREGVVLYQKNCRPCHGTKAMGDGPLARGLRLQPVDFTNPGTIATVVEQYPFWRIQEGAIGLPNIATPWNSAMPAWKDEIEPDDIWRIIMAEHRIAGTEPRKPEGEER